MKIALYIEDGREQIILTPQSDHEKAILGKLQDMYEGARSELTIKRGEFYACQGGWTRHGTRDESTIIVLDGA
jgi:hypothetical protein